MNIKIISSKSILSILDQVIVSGSNFFVTFFLGRHLFVPEFGRYTLINSIYYLIFGIHSALIASPLNINVQNKIYDKRSVIQGNFLIHIIFTVILNIIMVMASFLPTFKVGLSSKDFIFGAIFISALLLQELIRRISYSLLDLKMVLVNDLYCHVPRIILLLLTGYLFNIDLYIVYVLIILSAFIGVSIGVTKYVNIYGIKWTNLNINNVILVNWNFGKWLLGNQVFSWLNSQIFVFAGVILGSISVAANINATQTLLNPTNIFIISISNMMLPQGTKILVNQGITQFKKYVKEITLFAFLLMSVYCMIVSIFGDIILKFLYKGKYDGLAVLVILWCIVYLLSSFAKPVMIATQILGKPNYGFYSYLLLMVLSIILVVPIIKISGIYGIIIWAIFSSVITVVTTFFYYIKVIKKYEVRMRENENSTCW